ncbi:phosphoglycerate kinase [Candidatus Peregrinibacteria bacterium]|nr:phosphoglycerate kinase [Candidatus Peregrinibacteria bacterium]
MNFINFQPPHSPLQTLKDASVSGKRVLLRVDYNVPHCPETRNITDSARIHASIPTIAYLLDHGAKVIVLSHLGRPKGKIKSHLRLEKVAKELEKILKKPVKKLDDCIGPEVEKKVKSMKRGDILVLENVRFYPEEEANHPEFVKKLARLGDIFVSDSFGTVHREHASTAGISKYLPSYAGLLLEKEMKALSPLLGNPERPFLLVVGGAKIDTKIGILKSFLHKVDAFLIGGGLANTFLAAQGFNIGASLCQKDKIDMAREMMLEANKAGEKIILPTDVVVTDVIASNSKTLDMPIEDVEGALKIVDIGKITARRYRHLIEKSKTVVWNGPMGLYEYAPFQNGTREVASAIRDTKGITIAGGGDTLDALKRFNIPENSITHISTGGGAMLEFLEGKTLPGIEVLKKIM